MRINKRMLLTIMTLLLISLISACSSNAENKEKNNKEEPTEEIVDHTEEVFPTLNDVALGLNKISFDELEEKLDNKDSFWLVTIDYDRESEAKEIADEIDFEGIYDEVLKDKNMGVYFVDMYETYDKNGEYPLSKEEFNKKYSHLDDEWMLALYDSKRKNAEVSLVTNYGVIDLEPKQTPSSVEKSYDKVYERINQEDISWYAERLKTDVENKVVRSKSKAEKLID